MKMVTLLLFILMLKQPLINGEQYRNSYAWFFTFEDEEVTEVTAFLDMPAFEKVLEIEAR